jgi:hypothetical protein
MRQRALMWKGMSFHNPAIGRCRWLVNRQPGRRVRATTSLDPPANKLGVDFGWERGSSRRVDRIAKAVIAEMEAVTVMPTT